MQRARIVAVGMVRGGLGIQPVPPSSLVRISFDSPSPEWAQKIANGVAQTFIKQNMERRYGATAYARQFLKDRLDELKLKLEKSEQSLVDYARKMKIVSAGGDKSGDTGDGLSALNAALEQRPDGYHQVRAALAAGQGDPRPESSAVAQ